MKTSHRYRKQNIPPKNPILTTINGANDPTAIKDT